MSLCADCVKGVRHEGIPSGKWEKIGGVNCYVATPRGDYSKDTVVLYLADIYGPQLPNAQLLADAFASNGYKVIHIHRLTIICSLKTIALDYLNGDAAPADAFDNGSTFDGKKWLLNHGADKTRPPLDNVIDALKEQGVTKFGATGYCFEGRYVFDLAFENIIQVAVVSHPTLLKAPEDFEKYAATSKAPLLINSCTIDQLFPLESQAKADKILGGGKFAPGYKREFFEGCTHGFAVRGDLSDPKVKAGKEGAFKAAVQWFQTYLRQTPTENSSNHGSIPFQTHL